MDNFKISYVQQGKMFNIFNNARLKFLKNIASIWFNTACRVNQLTPNFVKVCKNSKQI